MSQVKQKQNKQLHSFTTHIICQYKSTQKKRSKGAMNNNCFIAPGEGILMGIQQPYPSNPHEISAKFCFHPTQK